LDFGLERLDKAEILKKALRQEDFGKIREEQEISEEPEFK